jgi:hypothetical protein
MNKKYIIRDISFTKAFFAGNRHKEVSHLLKYPFTHDERKAFMFDTVNEATLMAYEISKYFETVNTRFAVIEIDL